MREYRRNITEKECEQDDESSDLPTREALETHNGLLEFLTRIQTTLLRGCDQTPEWRPSLENMRKTWVLYKHLWKMNPHVDLYHEVNEESAEFNRSLGNDRILLRASNEENFNGQGLYFGVQEPYCWVHPDGLGEVYVLHDVPMRHCFPSAGSWHVMALLPARTLTGELEVDIASTIHTEQYYKDHNLPNTAEHLLVRTDDVLKENELWSTANKIVYNILHDNHASPENATWWMLDHVHHFPRNDRFLSERQIQFINETLGIIGIEERFFSAEKQSTTPSYQRFYVRETSPLLCSAVAYMTKATEIVYGVPGTPGHTEIQKWLANGRPTHQDMPSEKESQ